MPILAADDFRRMRDSLLFDGPDVQRKLTFSASSLATVPMAASSRPLARSKYVCDGGRYWGPLRFAP